MMKLSVFIDYLIYHDRVYFIQSVRNEVYLLHAANTNYVRKNTKLRIRLMC